jgi:N-acetylglucosaminyldiphosphoundecaprenol N-acetyl-beta-D-mannosaminyltransferase
MTSYDEVLDLLGRVSAERATVVAVCNVHTVMSCRRDPALAAAIGAADIATPDGLPLVWTLRLTGPPDQRRVYGPELMRRALVRGVQEQWRHYFYGATEDTLRRLTEATHRLAPGALVVGAESPPFRPLAPEEEEAVLERIRRSGADIVWVGIGMPKQELWMHRVRDRLPGVALLGVGAAFDFIAGTKPTAPAWMQRFGLEWLFRLASEPRRLWRRYLWNNPAFLLLMARQVVARRGRG